MFSTLLMMFTSGQPDKPPCESDGQEHIQKVDENSFLIDREYVSYYARNTDEAKDFGRVRWHKNVKGDIDTHSTTTGSFVVAGGIGVGKKAFIGTCYDYSDSIL